VSRGDSKLADLPESHLLLLSQAGNKEAFGVLVRLRQSHLRNFMRRLCGNATLADDLAQEVFLQVWRKLPQLKETARFSGWLSQIATNVWLQHVRKSDPLRGADVLINDDGSEPFHGAATAPTAPAGMSLDLDWALAQLASSARLCVVLSYHEGLTHSEIAQTTGLPQGTVKSHILRGTQRLRQLLDDYNLDETEGSL